jgi:hypothetical protein
LAPRWTQAGWRLQCCGCCLVSCKIRQRNRRSVERAPLAFGRSTSFSIARWVSRASVGCPIAFPCIVVSTTTHSRGLRLCLTRQVSEASLSRTALRQGAGVAQLRGSSYRASARTDGGTFLAHGGVSLIAAWDRSTGRCKPASPPMGRSFSAHEDRVDALCVVSRAYTRRAEPRQVWSAQCSGSRCQQDKWSCGNASHAGCNAKILPKSLSSAICS